jgi:hypothetical protein
VATFLGPEIVELLDEIGGALAGEMGRSHVDAQSLFAVAALAQLGFSLGLARVGPPGSIRTRLSPAFSAGGSAMTAGAKAGKTVSLSPADRRPCMVRS